MKRHSYLRVNVCIGARTDSALREVLIDCPPYQRGKLARSLMLDGLRYRNGESARGETVPRPAVSNGFREYLVSAFKQYVKPRPTPSNG